MVDGIIQGVDKHLGVKKGSTRNFKYMRSCLTSASPWTAGITTTASSDFIDKVNMDIAIVYY